MLQTISQISSNDRVYKTAIKAVITHVLLVENDSQLAQLIAQGLSCEGYQVSLTEDGVSGLLAARKTIINGVKGANAGTTLRVSNRPKALSPLV